MTGPLGGREKYSLEGREEKKAYHAYSCVQQIVHCLWFQRIISRGKTVCKLTALSWRFFDILFSFFTFLNSFYCTTDPNVKASATQWAKRHVLAQEWLPKYQLPTLFYILALSANLSPKVFSLKCCSAERANKQSHLSAGRGPLQHFRCLSQFTSFPTSARWNLLTQVYVSWTGMVGGGAKWSPPPPTHTQRHTPPPCSGSLETLYRREWKGRKRERRRK